MVRETLANAPALAGMGQYVAHEVNPAALPGGAENFRDGGLDALMGVEDHQLDAPQPPSGELAQKLGPDQLGLGSAYIHSQNLAATIGVEVIPPESKGVHK